MKELSFLMLLVALTVTGIAWICDFLKLDVKDKAVFYIPDRAKFNIVWGFVFYSTYGVMVAKYCAIGYVFVVLIAVLIGYLLYLYVLKKALSENKFVKFPIVQKIILHKIEHQKKFDKLSSEQKYTKNKALKMLGVSKFAYNRKDIIHERLDVLKKCNFQHPYYKTMIKYLEEAIERQ
ncbi:MAG: hypothetical protein II085_00875 [Alphaproteobacteria bacterium]|nr:hypothetical protein [Alphaproteobacteria bacterium]